MHTMITRPRGMKTPHMIWGGGGGGGGGRGGEREGEEGGSDEVFVLLTPNNLLKSPSSPIMDGGQLSIIGPLGLFTWIETNRGTVGFRLEMTTSGASGQSRCIIVLA